MSTASKVFIVTLWWVLFGESLSAQNEKAPILTYKECMEAVALYHPVAKQSQLLLEQAEANRRMAKGTTDPELLSDFNNKEFDGKEYYSKYSTKLKVATSTGLSFVSGIENTSGQFLNPEDVTTYDALWYLGAELDVLQGLLMNERKLAIKQAEVFSEMAQNEQEILLNQILYRASEAYLSWQQFYLIDSVLQENIDIATEYYLNTRTSFYGGEKTGMDTLEAYIAQQDAITTRQKNTLSLIKARKNLESYLWYKEDAMEIREDTRPQNLIPLSTPVDYLLGAKDELLTVPSLKSYQLKKESLDYDLRWKKEKLKPKLKVKYNALLSDAPGTNSFGYSPNNYNWGLSFQMPLFLRSERGAMKISQLKITETELELQNKSLVLQNKIAASLESQALLGEQIEILDSNVKGYEKLLNGENIKFGLGESSVFLLNKRQEKYIFSIIKLIEARVKKQSEILNYLYLTNTLRSQIF